MIKAKAISQNQKIDINIPTCWEDVTYSQWAAFNSIENKEDMFEVVAVLLNVDRKVVELMSVSSFTSVIERLEFIYNQEFTANVGYDKAILIDAVAYTFKPDLGDESIGCYEDWKAEMNRNKDKDVELIPLTLAHFLRPDGEVYDHTKITQRTELFKTISCVPAVALSNFFLLNSHVLKNNIQLYKAKQTLRRLKQGWLKSVSLVFMLPFTALLQVIYLGLMMLRVSRFMRFIRSCFTSKSYQSITKG